MALVAKSGGVAFHITGTDYFSPAVDDRLAALESYWGQPLVSETEALSRAEYLAGQMLSGSLNGSAGLDWDELLAAAGAGEHAKLLDHVRRFAAPRYQEGYQKGVHDEDAARMLAALTTMQHAAALLAYEPTARALALLYWQFGGLVEVRDSLLRRSRAAQRMSSLFGARDGMQQLEAETARDDDAALEQRVSIGGKNTITPTSADADTDSWRCTVITVLRSPRQG